MSADNGVAARRPRRVAGGLLVGGLALTVMVLGVAAQQRGAGTASLDDGPRLSLAPPVMTLSFAGQVDPADAHVWLTHGDTAVPAAAPVAQGGTVRTALRTTTDGAYRMVYHVRLTDGRRMTGGFDFQIVSGAPAGEPLRRDGPQGGHHDGGDDVTGALLLAVPVLTGLGVLIAAVRRRHQRDASRTAWTLRQAMRQQEEVR